MSDPKAPQDSPAHDSPAKNTPQKRRPGRNGGWLKAGNTVGVGRKPIAEVRGVVLQTADEATEVMREILQGTFKEEVRDRSGVVIAQRPAKIREVIAVYRCLLGHGLPRQREEIVLPDGRTREDNEQSEQEAQDERVRVAEAYDSLDDEEFAWAKRIADKITAYSRS